MIPNNTTRSMTTDSFGDSKLDKSKELNSSMSVDKNVSGDEYTRKIRNITGGNTNAN